MDNDLLERLREANTIKDKDAKTIAMSKIMSDLFSKMLGPFAKSVNDAYKLDKQLAVNILGGTLTALYLTSTPDIDRAIALYKKTNIQIEQNIKNIDKKLCK